MNKGYILLHRKVEDNPVVVQDNDYFRVWIHLLLNSSHSDHDMIFDGERRIIKRGQVLTSRKRLAKICNCTESKIERIIKWLISEQLIEQQTDSKSRIISILNYSRYQQSNTKSDINRTSTEHQSDTYSTLEVIKSNEKESKESSELQYMVIWKLLYPHFNLLETGYQKYVHDINVQIGTMGFSKVKLAVGDFLKDRDPGADCSSLSKFLKWGIETYNTKRTIKVEKETTSVWCVVCNKNKEVKIKGSNQHECCEETMLDYNSYMHEKSSRFHQMDNLGSANG